MARFVVRLYLVAALKPSAFPGHLVERAGLHQSEDVGTAHLVNLAASVGSSGLMMMLT